MKTTIIIDNYIERLFLFVTDLKHYLIILEYPWLRRHVVDVNFDFNILIIISLFCLSHYYSSSMKIIVITREKEEFLSFEESQRVWEHQNQESQFQTQNLA